MKDSAIKNRIKTLVASIDPCDQMEKDHIKNVCNWISNNDKIFRIKKDAVPPKHLVSYALVIDPINEKVLLFDHKKAQLMLPSGGHIEVNEMPLVAAKRELSEELGLSLEIYRPDDKPSMEPFFITVTKTVGISTPHTDISLWYLFKKDSTEHFRTDGMEYTKEFDAFHWLTFNEILTSPIKKFDPHMHRLIKKIKTLKSYQ